MGTENFDTASMGAENRQPPATPRKSRTTKLATEEWEIDGKVYTLTELRGSKKDDYQDLQLGRMKMKDGKPAGVSSIKDLRAILIQWHIKDEVGQEVPLAVIKDWPVSLQEDLEADCNKMSRMEKKEQEEAKN